jgi:hypothetical protein
VAIETHCPHCGQILMLKDAMAGRRGLCPKCKGTIEIPQPKASVVESVPRSIPVAETFKAPVFEPSPPPPPPPPQNGDIEVYRDKQVAVTTTRIVIAGTTYALRNITSVRMGVTDPSKTGPILLTGIGAMGFLGCLPQMKHDPGGVFWSLVLCVGMIVGGCYWYKSLKRKYHLTLSSASGESHALGSEDKEYIAAVVSAVNEAIVRY